MKKINAFILRSFMGLVLLFVAWACSDDDDEPQVVRIDFASATLEVMENNNDAVSVNLDLSGQSAAAGEIVISIANSQQTIYGTHYSTNPNGSSGSISLAIPANAQSVSFGFTPVDNNDDEENRAVTFTITSVSDNFELGDQESIEVTITDDEAFQPVSIAFSQATGELVEFATEPFVVSFVLGGKVEGAGTFTVTIDVQSTATSSDYSSEPAVSEGKITGNVNAGDEMASIMISAIDNQVDAPDKKLVLTLGSATGGLFLADQDLAFELTIRDDDESGPIELLSSRTAYTKPLPNLGIGYFEPREVAQSLVELVEETDIGGETLYGDAYFRFDLSGFTINPDNISNAEFIFNFPLWDPSRNGGELNPSVRFVHDIYAFEFENDWDQSTDTARVSLDLVSTDTISQAPSKVVTTKKYKASDDPNVIREEYESDRVLTITDFIKSKIQKGEIIFTIGLRKIENKVDNKGRIFKIGGPGYQNENTEGVLRPKLRIE